MNERDPRIDPQPGDVIRQANTNIRLRVRARDGGLVTWERKHVDGWWYDNEWSLAGWRDVVAQHAEVLVIAAPGEQGGGDGR